jgi:hypothetical protein
VSARTRVVHGLVLVPLVLAGCSTTVDRSEVAGRDAAQVREETAVAGPATHPAGDGTAPAAEATFDRPHTFPDGTVVVVSAPHPGGPAAGALHTVIVTIAVHNATADAVSLEGLGVDATAGDAELTALDEPAQPEGELAPGTTVRFDQRFPLPPTGPTEVIVEVSSTKVDDAGNDVPGTDFGASFGPAR